MTAKIVSSEDVRGDVLIPGSILHENKKYEITEMTEESFKNSQIETITFSEDSKIKTIPANSFSFSTIERLHLSGSIEQLDSGWCHQTKHLNKITVSPTNSHFRVEDKKLLIGLTSDQQSKYETVYFCNRDAKNVKIPETIKIIKSYSFEFCQALISVIFEDCNELITIEKFSFSNSTIEVVLIPSQVKNIDISAFYQNEHLKSFGLDSKLRLNTEYDNPFETNFSPNSLKTLIQYRDMINQIDEKIIRKIYSKFSFKYYKFKDQFNQINDQTFITKLIEYLNQFKFITYQYCNLNKKCSEPIVEFNISNETDCIICIERQCLILEQINIETINEIVNKLKSHKIAILNVSRNSKLMLDKNEDQSREEFRNFYEKYKKTIANNYFVEYTISSIVSYMIRRNYYPSYYFKDPSFFDFDHLNYKSNMNNNKYEFQKEDFIILRNLYLYNNSIYNLVIHIKTFYLFVIKQFDESTMKREKQFCEYSHSSFTRFYGFQRQNDKITGLIYEYMCNGSLSLFLDNNKTDEIYSMMTIIRLCEGIEYLHSNGLIHRDLKPSNILVDHNYFTYISDFETIRSTELSDGPFTNDIGSLLYSSPEQDYSKELKCSTDIYSFGLIIYYLYEKKHMLLNYSKNKIKEMNKGPFILHIVYEQCVQYEEKNRIKIQEIKAILLNCYKNIFLSFVKYLNYGYDFDYLKAKEYYEQSVKLDISESFNALGILYENGYGIEKDYMKAREYYEKSAQLNNYNAFIFLGKLYENGYGVKQDYLKAKEYYERSAQLNNSDAFLCLGNVYDNNNRVKKDYLKAKEYYERSAQLNNSDAFLCLGNFYANGYGVKQDYLKAKEYYEESSKLNNSDAFLCLGNFYANGYGVKQDYLKAKEYYEESAKLENSNAFNYLGNLYRNGYGVEQSYLEAKKYYEKSAKLNNSDALLYLGLLYANGHGVEQNYLIAKGYYEISAKLNNSNAFFLLGNLYKDGHGVKQDYLKAKEYYEISARLNNSFALNNLGLLYEYGYGVEQDYLKAKEYYEESAKFNNSDALCNLGMCYEDGQGVEQDYLKAIEYYEQSAELNNSDAFTYLIDLYVNGHGIHRNNKQDEKYFSQYCEKLAKSNNSDDLNKLGIFYCFGLYAEQDYLKAKNYFERSAQLNNSNAFILLGELYENGYGVEINYKLAKEYYEKSAQLHNSFAFIGLGDLYKNGHGVKQNYKLAKEYYEESAKLNNSFAFICLGNLYKNGHGVKQDYKQAKEYYEESAKLNNSFAFICLGILYENGYGVEQNYLKAKEYYEESAKFNNSDAFNNLGYLYYKGYGVEQNYKQAKEYYEESAKLNNSDAFINLGNLYKHGYGVEQNYLKVIECYEKSAKLNNAYAMNKLGLLYYIGKFVKKDYLKAKYYFEQSSKLSNSSAFFNLGLLYEDGLGVKKDYLKAIECYEKSAKLHFFYALNKLGNLYEKGQGVKQDYLKAKEYYEQSAKLNNSDSFNRLGLLYENGYGVKQNYLKARKYYEESAKFNDSDAFIYLGNLYRNGYGVEQDYLKAKEYYEISAQLNNSDAHFHLGDLYSNCDRIDPDLQRAIMFYKKSIEIERGFQKKIDKKDGSSIYVFNPNNYRYISYNDLGLIYLIDMLDKEKGLKEIKESAFAEYPFGQNNFGLINTIYLGNKKNAKYLFKKSSKHNFWLSEFNLSEMYEKENKRMKSLEYLTRASEHENEPLIYRGITRHDKRLEISKIFIICYTNLKLTSHYFSESKYDECKKSFTKTINNLKFNSSNSKYPFKFIIHNHQNQHQQEHEKEDENFSSEEYSKDYFSYLKRFILNFPLFNMMNQPNLDLNKYSDIFKKINDDIQDEHVDNENDEKLNSIFKVKKEKNDENNTKSVKIPINRKENEEEEKENNFFAKKIISLKKILRMLFNNNKRKEEENRNENEWKSKNINRIFQSGQSVAIIEDPCDLFEFVIKNPNSTIKKIFINEINNIIEIMKEIMYTPPYNILFGRICIVKLKQNLKKETDNNQNPNRRPIDESFYEGFGIL